MTWQTHASCRGMDPDLFFPQRGEGTREARLVCATCPVRQPCLDYAIDGGEAFGMWGGLSGRERRRIRRLGAAGIDTPTPVALDPLAGRSKRGPQPTQPCGTYAAYKQIGRASCRERV